MKKIILFVLLMVLIFSCVFVKGYSKEDLKNNVLYEEEINYIDLGYKYYTKEIEFCENRFVVMGYCFLGNEDEDLKFPYIAYYEDDELIWYKIERDISNGEFNSCVFTNDKIICSGTYSLDKKGSFIICYGLDGTTYESKIYNSNRSLCFKKLHYYKNKLYVAGETNSKDMLNKKTLNMEVFLYELDENFNICNNIYIGNSGDNEYIDSVFYQEGICFLIKISGNGYYDYNKLYPYILVKTDFRIDLEYYETLSFGKELKMITDDNYIYITDFDAYNNELKLYKYDESFDITFSKVLAKLPKNNLIYYYDYSYDDIKEDYLLTYMYRNNDDVICEYNIKNDKDENVLWFKRKGKTSEYMYKSSLVNGYIYEVGGRIDTNSHGIILVKRANLSMISDALYVNGYKANSENFTMSNKVYGYYDGKINYDYEGETFIVDGKYFVPLEINIEKDSVYNKGLILLFNGEGKLNGKRINSGESIDEVGNYVLEIYGKDDVSYYHFSIEDMVITDKNNEYKPLEEVKTNTSDYLNNNLNGNKNNKPFNYEDSLEVNYSYVLIIVIIGLVIGLVPITKVFTKSKRI